MVTPWGSSAAYPVSGISLAGHELLAAEILGGRSIGIRIEPATLVPGSAIAWARRAVRVRFGAPPHQREVWVWAGAVERY